MPPRRRPSSSALAESPAAAPVAGWPGSAVALARRTLFVRRNGTPGAPIAVFVHGLGGSSTNWTDLMHLVCDVVDGHAPDLPGHGRSAPPPGDRYDLSSHCAAVVDYIESIGGPVHLVGNSMGGAVSTRLAATRPDLVRTLTLVSPALPWLRRVKGSDPMLPVLLIPGFSALGRRYLAAQTPEKRADAVMDLCFADPSQVSPERREAGYAEFRRRRQLPWAVPSLVGSLRGLVAAYVDPSARNLWKQAARVQAPTLLIYGKQDRLVSIDAAPRAASTFSRSRLITLDDVGHVAMMERPQVVAEAFREHIRGSQANAAS